MFLVLSTRGIISFFSCCEGEDKTQKRTTIAYKMASTSSTPPPPSHAHLQQHLRVNKLLIEPLLGQAKKIRNVCILAHVDHGKTKE